MLSLMTTWHTEAQLIEEYEHTTAYSLSKKNYLKAQLLGRAIEAKQSEDRALKVVDDAGNLHERREQRRFLPQCYASASFLLALVPTEQIVALPKGFRSSTLFPSPLLDEISFEYSPAQTELLCSLKPDIAFVSSYSQPTAFLHRGIELFIVTKMGSLEEIEKMLVKVGSICGKADRAELLALFMRAAVCALNNRLLLAQCSSEGVLYLNHFSKFSIPKKRTLTGDLLDRLGINQGIVEAGVNCWLTPITHEKIVQINPRAIIVSALQAQELRLFLLTHPTFQGVEAVRENRIYTLDANTQGQSSQFSLLAYYDIVSTLLEIQCACL